MQFQECGWKTEIVAPRVVSSFLEIETNKCYEAMRGNKHKQQQRKFNFTKLMQPEGKLHE